MSILARVFVVLNFALAVAFLIFSVTAYSKRVKYYDEWKKCEAKAKADTGSSSGGSSSGVTGSGSKERASASMATPRFRKTKRDLTWTSSTRSLGESASTARTKCPRQA